MSKCHIVGNHMSRLKYYMTLRLLGLILSPHLSKYQIVGNHMSQLKWKPARMELAEVCCLVVLNMYM